YGPTETTIYSTASTVPRTGPITVGMPLPGVWVEILDEQGQSSPDGDIGEIWIGGIGVADGYLNRPELTEERVRAGTGDHARRRYRSGDLGRVLPSGEIDVRGRTDHQVKIRGYRIELGEIESALSALEGVSDAVVIDAEFYGERELVAYWIGIAEPNT